MGLPSRPFATAPTIPEPGNGEADRDELGASARY